MITGNGGLYDTVALGDGGTIDNASDGIWRVGGESIFGTLGSGPYLFTNAGSFTSAAGQNYAISFAGITFENTGTVSAESGALALLNLQVDGSGTLAGAPGATIQVSGNMLGQTQNAVQFAPLASVVMSYVNVQPPLPPTQLEVMSNDLGNVSAGFGQNFVYSALGSATCAEVKLVDNAQQPRADRSLERLYVDSLVVPPGSLLDLSGLHVYARVALINPNAFIKNGTINVLGDGGPINVNSIVPGDLAAARHVDDWSFFGRAGQAVTVIVHTGSGAANAPASPAVNLAQAGILDATGGTLASAQNGQAGADIDLNVTLPADGTFQVQVQGQGGAIGNYGLELWDATLRRGSVVVNQPVSGQLDTPYQVDDWDTLCQCRRPG